MKDSLLKFDEVGAWSELKLEIVEKYGAAYTRTFANTRIKKFYIDAFSGAGQHISKATGRQIEGSPARALNVSPPFDGFHFIDLNPEKTEYLESLRANRNNVHIHTEDANPYLTTKIFPTIRYENFNRALCLLDPYGLHLDWEVMLQAGRSEVIDLFLNFPVMDINRNAIWHDASKVPEHGIERMNRFWGDASWKQAAYVESDQQDLFSKPKLEKQDNKAIVKAFQSRLRTIAGFKHVPEALPMRNSTKAIVYYLFFASPKPIAEKIIHDIFKKYRA